MLMSDLLLAAAAALPLTVAATLLVGALWPAAKAMPIAWLTAVIVAATVWQLPIRWIGAATAWGVLLAIEILWIVFGALVLLYTLQQAGAISRITSGFASISSDHRVQTILVGFFLTTFLTGVAGFGTPAAIVAPLLVGLGFPALAAVIVALVGHAIATTFGAVGVPIHPGVTQAVGSIHGVSVAEATAFSADVSGVVGIYHLLPGLFMPLVTVSMLVYFFRRHHQAVAHSSTVRHSARAVRWRCVHRSVRTNCHVRWSGVSIDYRADGRRRADSYCAQAWLTPPTE